MTQNFWIFFEGFPKSLVPASKLIGLYIGSKELEFPEDGEGDAPVRVYFDHDSLVSLHEVNIILIFHF